MQLVEVADELYALAPHEFTRARDAASRRARQTGDRELASRLKQLRRPSVSAWVVNTLARRRPERLEELFELGASLRQAQQELAGADLRALSPRRYGLIRALSEEARKLLDDGEANLSPSVQREVQATLEAALVDEHAAAAVRSGRLMRALTPSGFEAVELSDAVAAFDGTDTPVRRPSGAPTSGGAARQPVRGAPRERATTRGRGTEGAQTSRPDAARRATATQAAEAARQRVERAARLLGDCDAAVAHAREALDAGQARISELERALKQSRSEQDDRHADQRRADRDRAAAARQHHAAQRQLAVARATLAGLDS